VPLSLKETLSATVCQSDKCTHTLEVRIIHNNVLPKSL